jgi:uncharacterized membrane protein YvbJ
MFCSKCGSKTEEGSNFCIKCGTMVGGSPVQQDTADNSIGQGNQPLINKKLDKDITFYVSLAIAWPNILVILLLIFFTYRSFFLVPICFASISLIVISKTILQKFFGIK